MPWTPAQFRSCSIGPGSGKRIDNGNEHSGGVHYEERAGPDPAIECDPNVLTVVFVGSPIEPQLAAE